MPTFDVILPSGRLILRDPETGAELTLTAEKGPVRLGRMHLSWSEAGALSKGDPGEALTETAAEMPHDAFRDAAESESAPPTRDPMREGKPWVRVLDAPFDALVEADFETAIAAYASDRDNLEREIEFLREIEAEEADVEELRAAHAELGEKLAAVTKRFDAWKRAQRPEEEDR